MRERFGYSVAIWTLLCLCGGPLQARIASEQPASSEPAVSEPAAPAADFLQIGRPPGKAGGRVVVALRAEPKTFHPVYAFDQPSQTILHRMMADLVHIDRETQQTVPALARSWEPLEDGHGFTVELRRGVRFSDGEPFDADDVLFTFKIHLDPKTESPYRALLQVGGKPLEVRKLSSHRVVFELPAPYAVGDRIFDTIAILPEHRLAEAYRTGELKSVWGLETRPAEIAGLGAFRLKSYDPGERLVLERNPHYWKTDADGQRLPYLDELVFLFVPNAEAQVLRFQAKETHLISELDAESFERLSARSGDGLDLRDLGASLAFQFLFFNLNDLTGKDLPNVARAQSWYGRQAFRQAVSMAIDRPGIVKLAYRGRATPVISHVTAGNKLWMNERLKPPEPAPQAARELLKSAGFSWDGSGRLVDENGTVVELTLVTNSGNRARDQIATIVQEDLRRLGLAIKIAPLDFAALSDRLFKTHEYEICLLGLGGGDSDPNGSLDIVTSTGQRHLWRLASGGSAATWQAEIDALMERQLGELDRAVRKQLFDRVQEILAEQLPWIPLVSPNTLVGADRDLGNFRPAILSHSTLWNADEIYWRRDVKARP